MDILMMIMGFVAGTVWRGRRFLIVFVLACMAVAAAVSLLLEPSYRASTLLVPNQSSSGLSSALGNLSGLVGQFGLPTGMDDPSHLYPEILRSRTLTQTILDGRVVTSDGTEVPYLEWLGIDGATEAVRAEKAGRKFREKLSRVVLNPKNSSIKIIVYDRDPKVAAEIANRMAAELDAVNREIGQVNARRKREFVESRLTDVKSGLADEEAALTAFREANRNYEDSPELTLEYERLRRNVRLSEELYLTLTRELEKARIDEFNDVPGINVLDPAKEPTERHAPRRGLIVVTAGLLSLLLGVILVLGWEGRSRFWASFASSRQGGAGA